MCIGRRLAEQEILALLAATVTRFKVGHPVAVAVAVAVPVAVPVPVPFLPGGLDRRG